ncbi:hypothetical protein JOS77_16960 [Chromobacterium haemolyticum]|nr:hypothetical protein JOS77_16960 [Chromobacterium haemolyticum]
MKFISILFTIQLFWVGSAFSATLDNTCRNYGGTMINNTTIFGYGAQSITADIFVRVQQNNSWYRIAISNNASSYLYDLAKTAYLSKLPVSICVNPGGEFLLGIELAQ